MVEDSSYATMPYLSRSLAAKTARLASGDERHPCHADIEFEQLAPPRRQSGLRRRSIIISEARHHFDVAAPDAAG